MEPVTRARALWIPGLIAALALLGACSGGDSAPDGGATAGARTTAAGQVQVPPAGTAASTAGSAPQAPVPATATVASAEPSASSSASGAAAPSNSASAPAGNPSPTSRCPAGTCVVRDGGPCERPTGQLGNGCCSCGADGRCRSPCRCNGPDLPVATPDGPRRIADLREGDLVYSVEDGAFVVVPVIALVTRAAPETGYVRVELLDGTSFVTSAVHPLADGRTAGDLAGDPGVRAVSATPRPAPATHDLLPASRSGIYVVGGVLFATTVRILPGAAEAEAER